MCQAKGYVTNISNKTIKILLLAQPTGCEKTLSLTGVAAKDFRDIMGAMLAVNVVVHVYWGPSGEVKLERRFETSVWTGWQDMTGSASEESEVESLGSAEGQIHAVLVRAHTEGPVER